MKRQQLLKNQGKTYYSSRRGLTSEKAGQPWDCHKSFILVKQYRGIIENGNLTGLNNMAVPEITLPPAHAERERQFNEYRTFLLADETWGAWSRAVTPELQAATLRAGFENYQMLLRNEPRGFDGRSYYYPGAINRFERYARGFDDTPIPDAHRQRGPLLRQSIDEMAHHDLTEAELSQIANSLREYNAGIDQVIRDEIPIIRNMLREVSRGENGRLNFSEGLDERNDYLRLGPRARFEALKEFLEDDLRNAGIDRDVLGGFRRYSPPEPEPQLEKLPWVSSPVEVDRSEILTPALMPVRKNTEIVGPQVV